ncbi:unnamed protein product [Ranitomeya imitator]|uniref:Intimal thickness related receptor IRP domain-containing protein n=1 Tax=Ranitomeya imitator TaxID=111125 RepID=A0ABN9MER5_9NEOB|nr:unnamed protein product [Ranitomeya imitator]
MSTRCKKFKGLFSLARNTSVSRMWKRSSGASTPEQSVQPRRDTWSRTRRSRVPAPELRFHMRDTDVFLACGNKPLERVSFNYSWTIIGSGTFILLSHLSLRWRGAKFFRQQVQTGLVTVWAVRLGTFLFLRILRDGHDRRFDKVRDNPGMFFVYWTVQGIWIFVTLLPSLMLNLETRNKPLGLKDYLGWTLWTLGFSHTSSFRSAEVEF